MHFDLSPSLEKIKLTRMEKLICGVRVFVLVFMCYLLNQLFENNENVHKKFENSSNKFLKKFANYTFDKIAVFLNLQLFMFRRVVISSVLFSSCSILVSLLISIEYAIMWRWQGLSKHGIAVGCRGILQTIDSSDPKRMYLNLDNVQRQFLSSF